MGPRLNPVGPRPMGDRRLIRARAPLRWGQRAPARTRAVKLWSLRPMKEELLDAVLPEERRLRIAAQLRRDTRVRVEDLAVRYSVSGETIRRDLQVLEERGILRRVYGGAVAQEARGWEPGADD